MPRCHARRLKRLDRQCQANNSDTKRVGETDVRDSRQQLRAVDHYGLDASLGLPVCDWLDIRRELGPEPIFKPAGIRIKRAEERQRCGEPETCLLFQLLCGADSRHLTLFQQATGQLETLPVECRAMLPDEWCPPVSRNRKDGYIVGLRERMVGLDPSADVDLPLD